MGEGAIEKKASDFVKGQITGLLIRSIRYSIG